MPVVCGNDVTFDWSVWSSGVSFASHVAGAGYLSGSIVVLVTGCVSWWLVQCAFERDVTTLELTGITVATPTG